MRRFGWRTAVGAAVVVATLFFLGRTIAGHWRELQAYEWSVRPLPLSASVILLLLVFAWGVWVWQVILRHIGVRVRFPALLRIWFLSSLARYVPGKVWQFVGAAQLGRGAGIPAVPLLTSMVIQTAFLLASAALIGAPFYLLTTRAVATPGGAAGVTAAAAAFAIVAVHPRVLNAALGLVPRALHREVIRWTGGWGDGVALLGLYLVSWIGNGLAFALFVSALVDVPAAAVPGLVAANALAVAAGVLVFVVPAGLGAREAALTLLLAPLGHGAGVAALLALASRLWVLAAEVVGAAVVAWRRPRIPGAGAAG